MIEVPEQFRPHIRVEYPTNNKLIFEEWFYQNRPKVILGDRYYLPVFWTSYYVNHDYGNNARKIGELQDFINSLDKSKKYFTIVQYDDGILNDISHLDIKIFGMGGGRIDHALPLLCMPHPYEFSEDRDINYSFSGSMTHPVRRKLPGYCTAGLNIEQYCKLMARSVFALCPRGYGPNSFRISEALQYGAIPVYISDRFIVPHGSNFNDYGILCDLKEVRGIQKKLDNITMTEIRQYQEAGKRAYKDYYTYSAAMDNILNS